MEIIFFVLPAKTHCCHPSVATSQYQSQKTKNEFLRDDYLKGKLANK
jgi:hypothetical protein